MIVRWSSYLFSFVCVTALASVRNDSSHYNGVFVLMSYPEVWIS
jgi:hypothetical protein